MPGQVHFYTLDCILRQFCCASLAPTNFRLLCGGQLCHYHDKQPIVVSLTPPRYASHRCHPLCRCCCWLAATCAASLCLCLSLGTPAVASSFLRRISSCSLSGEVEFQSDQSSIQFCGSKVGTTKNGSSQTRSNFSTIGLSDTCRRLSASICWLISEKIAQLRRKK